MTSNPDLAHWMRELRKSSAASPHKDRRTKRKRTRKNARRADINEQRLGSSQKEET